MQAVRLIPMARPCCRKLASNQRRTCPARRAGGTLASQPCGPATCHFAGRPEHHGWNRPMSPNGHHQRARFSTRQRRISNPVERTPGASPCANCCSAWACRGTWRRGSRCLCRVAFLCATRLQEGNNAQVVVSRSAAFDDDKNGFAKSVLNTDDPMQHS